MILTYYDIRKDLGFAFSEYQKEDIRRIIKGWLVEDMTEGIYDDHLDFYREPNNWFHQIKTNRKTRKGYIIEEVRLLRESRLVGFIDLQYNKDTACWGIMIYVSPEDRGRGYSNDMINFIKDELKKTYPGDKPNHKLFAYVSKDNKNAHYMLVNNDFEVNDISHNYNYYEYWLNKKKP